MGPNSQIAICNDRFEEIDRINVHTSCSVPIGEGCQFCSDDNCLTIVEAFSKYNGLTCPCEEEGYCGDGVIDRGEECDNGSNNLGLLGTKPEGEWCSTNCIKYIGEDNTNDDCECLGKVNDLEFTWTGAVITRFWDRKTGDLVNFSREGNHYRVQPNNPDSATLWDTVLGVNVMGFAGQSHVVTIHTSCSVLIGKGCTFSSGFGVATIVRGSSLNNGELCDYSEVADTCAWKF